MERSGLLLSVVMHEMGHVLGIGTIWDSLGLLSGGGTNNPIFVGAHATAAYNQLFGTSASGVPIENTGGPGTADGHWRETVFGSELMTGWAGPGANLPLSVVTIGSLADIGYTVDYAAADTYVRSLTSSALASIASSTGTRRSLQAAPPVGASLGGNPLPQRLAAHAACHVPVVNIASGDAPSQPVAWDDVTFSAAISSDDKPAVEPVSTGAFSLAWDALGSSDLAVLPTTAVNAAALFS